MIAAGIIIVGIGLILGVGFLTAQMVAVLLFGSIARWTDPYPTIVGMGLTTVTGLGTLLAGLFQFAAP
jgi:hypothetical protein